MILRSKIQDVLFLNIETVPLHDTYEEMSHFEKFFWNREKRNSENYATAANYAEFGRIMFICVGNIGKDNECDFLKLRCFYNEDEKKLLIEFNSFLLNLTSNTSLCAYNGKAFDFPFICRRMLIHGIELAPILQNLILSESNKDLILDTLDIWRFGEKHHYTSLNHLAHLFDIETYNEEEILTSQSKFYYLQNDLQKVVDFCYSKIITNAQLLLRFINQNTIRTENIYYV